MKKIYIFDLDDVLIKVLPFSAFLTADSNGIIDTSKEYSDYFKKIKSLFWDKASKNVLFKKSGDFVVIIDADTKRPINPDILQYVSDKKNERNFEVKNDLLLLRSFPGFHSDPNTLGKEVNNYVFKDYSSAENKMILTGRDEELRPFVEKSLKEMGIEYPNYGLYMFPGGSKSIKDVKTEVILNTIQEHGWDEVHFYEDRKDWLYHAEGSVKSKFPNVKFVPHLITNVKDSHKFH